MKLFEDARRALLESGEWPSPGDIRALSPGEFDQPSVFRTDEAEGAAGTVGPGLVMLQRGIRAEERAIVFYSEQQETTDDPNAKAMYAYLIEQEELHRSILQAQYDYLERTDLG